MRPLSGHPGYCLLRQKTSSLQGAGTFSLRDGDGRAESWIETEQSREKGMKMGGKRNSNLQL